MLSCSPPLFRRSKIVLDLTSLYRTLFLYRLYFSSKRDARYVPSRDECRTAMLYSSRVQFVTTKAFAGVSPGTFSEDDASRNRISSLYPSSPESRRRRGHGSARPPNDEAAHRRARVCVCTHVRSRAQRVNTVCAPVTRVSHREYPLALRAFQASGSSEAEGGGGNLAGRHARRAKGAEGRAAKEEEEAEKVVVTIRSPFTTEPAVDRTSCQRDERARRRYLAGE